MKLKDLLNGIDYTVVKGDIDKNVDEVIYDSRIKTSEGLFIAIEGFQTDGHNYIEAAINNGAKTILVQKDVDVKEDDVTVIKTPDTRIGMATVASNAYDNPSKNFELVGVTGTNGKTSITFLLGQILEAHNKKIGIIGTIENRIGTQVLKAERTTPESLDLQKLFRKMADSNVDVALMEVSSHALALDRAYGSHFKIGIFTNLTQDHLDFHKTMENYAEAKSKLFRMCGEGIVNIDSPYIDLITKDATAKLKTYAIDREADFRATDIDITAAGVTYNLINEGKTYKIEVPIPGKFTVYNTLAVIVAATKLGISIEESAKALKNVKGVPGRVQSFTSKNGYSVLVDYAHTPDGLENVLETIKEFAKGRIITVFGCGGDRDRTKRPIMGEIASKYSDHVIITSDNPRTEDPTAIINEIEVGVKGKCNNYDKIESREDAIIAALKEAKKDDVVLVAGKGHENYQILKEQIIHFDDCEVVRKFLQEEK